MTFDDDSFNNSDNNNRLSTNQIIRARASQLDEQKHQSLFHTVVPTLPIYVYYIHCDICIYRRSGSEFTSPFTASILLVVNCSTSIYIATKSKFPSRTIPSYTLHTHILNFKVGFVIQIQIPESSKNIQIFYALNNRYKFQFYINDNDKMLRVM